MSDTARTKAEILALLADNSTGAISAQDLRDFVETILGCYSGLYICEGSDSQNVTSSGKTTIDQWVSAQAVSDAFDTTDGDQLLTIPVTGVYDVSFSCTYNTDSVYAEVFRVRVTQNGSALPGLCDRRIHYPASLSSPDVVHPSTGRRLVSLTAGDELELEVEAGALGSTRTFAIKHASLVARLVG